MSLTRREYAANRKAEGTFFHRLGGLTHLNADTLNWLAANGKAYSSATLSKFGIQKGVLTRYDKRAGYSPAGGSRGVVWGLPCIVIPVGPIYRCYVWNLPKPERWCVVPAGYPAQWLGELSFPDLILCEGEWDFLRLQDMDFTNAVTHTAGSMTWCPAWTPYFRGKRVWVCYDRDLIGRRGAAKVAKILHRIAEEVKIIDLPLPGTPEAKDVSDFFKMGGTRDDFNHLLRGARQYAPVYT